MADVIAFAAEGIVETITSWPSLSKRSMTKNPAFRAARVAGVGMPGEVLASPRRTVSAPPDYRHRHPTGANKTREHRGSQVDWLVPKCASHLDVCCRKVAGRCRTSLRHKGVRRSKICYRKLMGRSEIPDGHEPGNRRCPSCIEITKETLEDCPACEGLLHRVGDEEVCDRCNEKRSVPALVR
jgi:hypothetical protein